MALACLPRSRSCTGPRISARNALTGSLRLGELGLRFDLKRFHRPSNKHSACQPKGLPRKPFYGKGLGLPGRFCLPSAPLKDFPTPHRRSIHA